jgi:hypothetical protein
MARRERVTMTGLLETERAVNQAIQIAGRATAAELIEFALHVTGDAALNAPIEFGDLRAGITMEVNGEVWARGTPEGGVEVLKTGPIPEGPIMIRIGTAGFAYALVQHERLDYVHPRGGGPKYLENALNKHLPTLIGNIKAQVQAELQAEFGGGSA